MSDTENMTIFVCGNKPNEPEHQCDTKGEFKEVPSSFGPVHSAHCSVCCKPAFSEWEI